MAHALGAFRLRVLVIDDDPDLLATVAHALRHYGCRVETALGGAEGVRAAREFQPEIVLCDLVMPGLDGRAVAAALRSDPVTSGVRLVAFTGNLEFSLDVARRAGFDDVLPKPGGLALLGSLVARSSAA